MSTVLPSIDRAEKPLSPDRPVCRYVEQRRLACIGIAQPLDQERRGFVHSVGQEQSLLKSAWSSRSVLAHALEYLFRAQLIAVRL
jgi:hypothetical protein